MSTRRRFLQQLSTASLVAGLGIHASRLVRAAMSTTDWPIAIFEKVFEGLSYEELADAIAQIGADGVEATIRPKGHIEPEAAADEVPKMAEAMRTRGKRIVIAATHIRSVDEPHTESLLRTLKTVGITHYRMGHYYLELDKPMMAQVTNYASQARELAALNKQIGIQGLYQNHSGGNPRRGYLGALGWDAAMMLSGIDSDALGLAFDTRHLMKDTGSSLSSGRLTSAGGICRAHSRFTTRSQSVVSQSALSGARLAPKSSRFSPAVASTEL